MIDRQKTKPGRSGEQGAALVVAIAIMTILLAVALTFYAVSRQEVTNAVNVRNQVQVDLLLDGTLAMVQSELNRDFLKNPGATSLDSAAFSYFNGSWAVGKQWALRNGLPLQAAWDGLDNDFDGLFDAADPDERGVPQVNMTDLPLVRFNPVNPADSIYVEALYGGPLSRDWLYYPRFEDDINYLYGAPQFTDGVASIDYLDRITLAPFTNYRNGDPFNPAVFDLSSDNRPPFVTPAFYGPSGTDGFVDDKYPVEWISTWTDVDNNGDGQNDAIWIPLPQDKFFSGGEFREEVGRFQYDDGVDNDLDYAAHVLPGGVTTVRYDENPEAGEGEIELAAFVYNGAVDGLDNDGDGVADEGDENKLFLTTPLTDLRVYLDFNADGLVPDLVPDSAGVLRPLMLEVLPGNVTVQTSGGPVNLTNLDVDAIDNDYDMLVNDYQLYAYVGPNTNTGAPFMIRGFEDTGVSDGAGGTIVRAIENASANNNDPSAFAVAERKSYERINILNVLGDPNTVLAITPSTGTFYSDTGGAGSTYNYEAILRNHVVLTHSGEPVCELAGRAAITIRDESSAVNVNVASGHTQNLTGTGLIRALGSGESASEYDTRALPGIGITLAYNMYTYRMGRPTDDSQLSTAGADFFNSFSEDADAPGYGRVDDNANILLLALNGVDDDGDGLVDEGLYLPEPGDIQFNAYYSQLGLFEGTDDPGEFQRYRALGNLLAENRDPFTLSGFADNDDNDLDGANNETGELGDLHLQDTLQFQEVPSIGSGIYGRLRQSITSHSTDRNVNFVRGRDGIRALNKLDYNFANPQEIAGNLILSNGTQGITASAGFSSSNVTRGFAEGLRQGNVHIRSANDLVPQPAPIPPNPRLNGLLWVPGATSLEPTVESFPADPVLEILQAAVDIVDNRDSDHSRSVLSTERQNRVPQTAATGFVTFDTWPARLGTRESIPEDEILPLGELESYSFSTLGLNRRLEIRDDWWTFEAGVVGASGVNQEKRHISYTASGNEAIKINELMVRPVRRIEAEMINPTLVMDASDPMVGVLNPVNYDPTAGYAALPEFEAERTQSALDWTLFPAAPVPGFIGSSAYLETDTAGEIIQFRIRASEGLPAGRYYLTVNTNGTVIPQALPVPGPGLGPMLEYSIKYDNGTDIIGDGLTAVFVQVPNERLSDTIPGAPGGSAFLNGVIDGNGAYFVEGGGIASFARTSASPTFTVLVPPAGSPDLLIAFRLAAAHNGTNIQIDSLDFSQEPDHEWVELVNTSAEIVDVGGWALEVGIPRAGDDVPEDPFKSLWRIPTGTNVAPNGMLLLSFSKYDHYQRDFTIVDTSLVEYPNHRIGDNGMGLAVSTAGAGQPFNAGGYIANTFSLTNRNITAPPIADVSPLLAPANVYRDTTGSVFDRPIGIFVDYIDRDGDGLSSIFNLTPALDTDSAFLEGGVRSSSDSQITGDSNNDGLDDASGVAMARRPWDRIVQMECIQWTTDNPTGPAPVSVTLEVIQDADDVAIMVLRGGILPNYPEHDEIDNDGDGGYVDAAGNYIPGTLERDMVDNNLDGIIDERGIRYTGLSTPGDPRDGLDSDGDTVIDEQDEWYLSYTLSAGEGVDEGRIVGSDSVTNWRAYGTGTYEQYTLPYVFLNNRAAYDAQYGLLVTDPGSMIAPVDGTAGFGFLSVIGSNADTGNFVTRLGDAFIPPTAPPTFIVDFFTAPAAPYIGTEADPADWKAFAERRWNPGDNVIVTLYEGEASLGKVADRVTYREYDVINRTIDDIQPYLLDTNGDDIRELAAPLTINGNYPTFWLANSMALDFYRSLERKSPLYSGDRFGTENRWQATDGNYDDWSDSLSYFEIELASTSATYPPVLSSDGLVDGRTRFPNPLASNTRQDRLFRHAMAGSPLRMNAAARKSLNPPDLERVIANNATPPPVPRLDTGQFFDSLDYFRTHEDGVYDDALNPTKSIANQTWNHSRAQVANRFYQSLGDLMRVPHQTYLHDAVNTMGGADFLRDMTMLNIHLQGDGPANDLASDVQDIALRSATLGQDDYGSAVTGNILTAALNSMSTDSVVLTVGQSEFRPIRPDLTDTVRFPTPLDVLDWMPYASGGALMAPGSWAPVFLFDMDSYGPGGAGPTWDNDPVTAGPPMLERFPFYPTYVDGGRMNDPFRRNYLFNGSHFFNNQGPAYLATALPNHFQDRLPLERRVTMYVSQVRPGTLPDERPEGLFIWDGEDGLENGEYTLYIGTYIPHLRQRVLDAAMASAGFSGEPAMSEPDLLYQSASNIAVGSLSLDPVTYEVLRLDPTHQDADNARYNPVFALDVITDPTEARGVAPRMNTVTDPSSKPGGLIHPDDWNPVVEYRAGSDGYIHYGNNAAGGWRPQTVRVTDNYLAVRVRNVGDQSDVGIITHVVLAPRKRTAGRVNVNTVQSRISTYNPAGASEIGHEYFNALMGLPGVVDAATSVQPAAGGFTAQMPPAADIDLLAFEYPPPPFVPVRWSPPIDLFNVTSAIPVRNHHDNDPPLTDVDLLVPNSIASTTDRHMAGSYRLSAMLMGGRTEHADGRYYTSLGSLADNGSAFDFEQFASRADVPTLTPQAPIDWWDYEGVENEAVYPLSNESLRWKRFDEIKARLSRMGDLITTRSDVFQIIMTVEAGYGVDKNGDGFINYRDREEFVTTAATKATAVYERRSPSDQSDGQE